MRSRAFLVYLILQALLIGGFVFAPLYPAWGHSIWETAVGWIAAVGVVIGVRLHKPPGSRAWYLFALGVLLNSSGLVVEAILNNVLHSLQVPSWADACWLGLFPCQIVGMMVLIRARTVKGKSTTLGDTATMATAVGLLTWVFLMRPGLLSSHRDLPNQIVHFLYPLGDLVVVGLMIRLVLGGGRRSASFRFLVASIVCFMVSDVIWAAVVTSDPPPFTRALLEMNSMWAWALVGASALHPSVTRVAEPAEARKLSLTPLLMVSLLVSTMIAPVVLFFEALKHDVVDGMAIALSSMAMFVLVVWRMAQLLREVVERNRAVRLVLDTVNEGLVRVSEEGILSEERSAMLDQWFGPFCGRVTFVDYLTKIDAVFAQQFAVGFQALQEDFMPLEVCLHQMPKRLHFGDREFSCVYLPVIVKNVRQGLLIVIEEVTDQVRLANKDAEHRELLAMFEEFTRDRTSFLAIFDEVNQLIERATAVNDDVTTQMRTLHTIKGTAGLGSLTVIADLCHRAEDEIQESQLVKMTPLISALHNRWRALTTAFRVFLGDDVREMVELRRPELKRLAREVRAGLPIDAICARLDTWMCEPVERPLERLANAARTLSLRLGKGDPMIQIESNHLRLDPRRWSGLWAELVHVVRNAVDHGFEEGEHERSAVGKPPRPSLRLGAYRGATDLKIEIEDDGRGLDWEGIRRSALAKGLKADTDAELLEALLGPGLSTRTEVSAISGRGVGVSAVSARVRELGGKVTVSSKPGAGTCWGFTFPLSTLQPSEHRSQPLDPRQRERAFSA